MGLRHASFDADLTTLPVYRNNGNVVFRRFTRSGKNTLLVNALLRLKVDSKLVLTRLIIFQN